MNPPYFPISRLAKITGIPMKRLKHMRKTGIIGPATRVNST